MRTVLALLGSVILVAHAFGTEDPAAAVSADKPEPPPVQAVALDDNALARLGAKSVKVAELLETTKACLGVPYKWGGASLTEGIDCSNFTWQICRAVGLPYNRYYSTRRLARIEQENGLRKIDYEEATTGDLLVYGYAREGGRRSRWKGHVVILLDKDGALTGHPGLSLGAHGGEIDAVRFVTYLGHDEGYYKDPKMRLCNVLRVDGMLDQATKDEPAPDSTDP